MIWPCRGVMGSMKRLGAWPSVAGVLLLLQVPLQLWLSHEEPMGGWASQGLAALAVFSAWSIATVPMLCTLLAARELRMPSGVSRVVFATMTGLAAWTFAVTCVPPLLWHVAPALDPELTVFLMGVGALFAMIGSSFQGVLWPVLFLVLICRIFDWSWALTRPQLTILSGVMLLIVVGRTIAIGRALGRGSRPALSPLLEAFSHSTEKRPEGRTGSGRARRGVAGWRGTRTPSSVVRTALGPPYEHRTLLKEAGSFLCVFGFITLPFWFSYDQVSSNLMVLGFLLIFMPMACITWTLGITTRLAALLSESSGELAEVALLPGAGSAQEQGRVLLRETLLRPIASGAPLLLGYAVVLGRVNAPPAALLPAVLLVVGMVLMFATATLGVLARKFRTAAWPVLGVGLLFWLPGMLALYDLRADRGISITQGLAWLLPLGSLLACLIPWGRLVFLRQRLLYP